MLRLPQHKINHPAAADVGAGAATVVEDVGGVTAGILEGIGEDGHGAEIAGVVHLLRELNGGGGSPRGLEVGLVEGITKDAAECIRLKPELLITFQSPVARFGETLKSTLRHAARPRRSAVGEAESYMHRIYEQIKRFAVTATPPVETGAGTLPILIGHMLVNRAFTTFDCELQFAVLEVTG